MLSFGNCLLSRCAFRNTSVSTRFFMHSAVGSRMFISSTAVLLGSQFEKQTMDVLKSLNMNLQQCGGPNDQGIDIQVKGEWNLDLLKVPIFVQCKNTKITKPQFIREFVGVMGREYNQLGISDPSSLPKDKPAPIGILSCSSSITNSVLRESALNPFPLLICQILDSSIKSLQPNYSLLRVYPDLQFVFDINHTDIPTVLYKDKIIFEKSF